VKITDFEIVALPGEVKEFAVSEGLFRSTGLRFPLSISAIKSVEGLVNSTTFTKK
jgi:hypothetical protein